MKLRHASLAIAVVIALTAALMPPGSTPAAAAPERQITFAVHVSLAPSWFDPAETDGVITPFTMLYALHWSAWEAGPPATPRPGSRPS